MSTAKLRIAMITNADLDWARKLRNKNRKAFFNSATINQNEMENWFRGIWSTSEPDFYIIWLGDERVGTISAQKVGKLTKIGNVIIAEEYRARGILKEVLKLITKLYTKNFELEVKADNKFAADVYKALGFKPYGIRMRR